MPEMFSKVVVDSAYLDRLEQIYSAAKAFVHALSPYGRESNERRLEEALEKQIQSEICKTREPRCTCLPAGPGHDHSDDCALERYRKSMASVKVCDCCGESVSPLYLREGVEACLDCVKVYEAIKATMNG